MPTWTTGSECSMNESDQRKWDQTSSLRVLRPSSCKPGWRGTVSDGLYTLQSLNMRTHSNNMLKSLHDDVLHAVFPHLSRIKPIHMKYLAPGLIAVVLNPLSITVVPITAVRRNNRDLLAKCLLGWFLVVNINSSSEEILRPESRGLHKSSTRDPPEVDYSLFYTFRPFSAVYRSFFCLLNVSQSP